MFKALSEWILDFGFIIRFGVYNLGRFRDHDLRSGARIWGVTCRDMGSGVGSGVWGLGFRV